MAAAFCPIGLNLCQCSRGKTFNKTIVKFGFFAACSRATGQTLAVNQALNVGHGFLASLHHVLWCELILAGQVVAACLNH